MTLLDSSQSIINYFEKSLTWDIFLQGFFVLNAFLVGISILFYTSQPYHQPNQSFLSFYSTKIINRLQLFYKIPSEPNGGVTELYKNLTSITQFLGLGSVFIMLAFTSGVLTNHVSDAFMDKGDKVHFGLKKIWVPKPTFVNNTDDSIKIKIFDKVFPEAKDSMTSIEKLQVYYSGKHKILASETWKNYLGYSQNLVNLCQSFCFASWMMIIFSLMGIFFSVTTKAKQTFYKQRLRIEFVLILTLICFVLINSFTFFDFTSKVISYTFLILVCSLIWGMFSANIKGHRVITSLVFFMIAILGYFLSAVAWKNGEKETCSKTFGLIKYFDTSAQSKELNKLSYILKNANNIDTTSLNK